uniref:Clathrin/coatomer adaptor adaptin-like N-terminal domain-containing protein n=1 Tax=Phlebotomus papatasi TaxID=29031 RepID=A0A1B0D8I4_PHLPP
MSSFKRDKKEEEDGGGNPFQNLEKTAVLQETRSFNETPVNARKCTHILTKILYLINQGEQLAAREATDCFFATTKLFQSKDVILRRMVYLGIKELSSTADDVIIVTSSLTKDMTGKEDLYRAAGRNPDHHADSIGTLEALPCQFIHQLRHGQPIGLPDLIEEEDQSTGGLQDSPLFEFIESCLRHKSEMVIYEAAHAIVNLKRTGPRELAPAVSILQLFCGSPKATLRFAAVRTMNKVAMQHPAAVTACNLDLEGLITDSNRSVATLAITTLLKTGAESSVERLMKQIATFVAEISDEFKVVVVQAIRALCSKFPRKHPVLMNFLSGMLREEGGLEYKTSIVDTIITIIEENPDAKEAGLSHLCEFIEDCEHTSLAVRILHLLGKEGPFSKAPSRYIRFVYNRVILENATVRAAAVSAMAQFGAACPDLLQNILVLLNRCQMDTDDEVRDRATYYLTILKASDMNLSKSYVSHDMQLSLPLLEKALKEHLNGSLTDRFDLSIVPNTAP